MTKLRQLIRPGDSGSDVTAVKWVMRKTHAPGYETLAKDNHAGTAFVDVLNAILRNHHKKQDGIYGEDAHAIISPHFDLYRAMLYRTAKIRKPPEPPLADQTARQLAIELQALRQQGRYFADNPGDLRDINDTAAGNSVWSQGGGRVQMWPQPFEVVVWLIEEKGFKIGTYAFCSDHHFDGWRGHSGGRAVDIHSINGIQIGSWHAHDLTLQVAKLLVQAPGELRPRQLICDGYGYMHSSDISACCIPYASFYGYETLAQHRNHIHVGY